jgi:hypothetical protein
MTTKPKREVEERQVVDPRDLTAGLARVLGPAEPVGREIGCDVCFDELDRFVELELGGGDADGSVPGLRAHLAGCPACGEEHDSLYAFVGGELLA